MTTRIMRTQRTRKPPLVFLHCPGCRAPRKCRPVGTATVDGKRLEVVECTDKTCELRWVPTRQHIPAQTPAAA